MFDISLTGAFLAGLLSFLSPCILPMVPFYLSYLGGMSAAEVSQGGTITRETPYPGRAGRHGLRRRGADGVRGAGRLGLAVRGRCCATGSTCCATLRRRSSS